MIRRAVAAFTGRNFHSFWDYDAVNALFPQLPRGLRKTELEAQIEPLKKGLVHDMAGQEPHNGGCRQIFR